MKDFRIYNVHEFPLTCLVIVEKYNVDFFSFIQNRKFQQCKYVVFDLLNISGDDDFRFAQYRVSNLKINEDSLEYISGEYFKKIKSISNLVMRNEKNILNVHKK